MKGKVASNTADPTVITWKYCVTVCATVKCVTTVPVLQLKVEGYSPRDLGKDWLLCFSILRVKTLHWLFQAPAISISAGWGGHRVSCDEKVLQPHEVTY